MKGNLMAVEIGATVRLTGVIRATQSNGNVGIELFVGCQNGLHWYRPEEIQVIREPFRRGESVWGLSSERVYDVLEDEEENGYALMVERKLHAVVFHGDVTAFERRPRTQP